MKNQSSNKNIGMIILVALALMYIKIPFIDGRNIAALALLGCGIYLLVKG